MKSQVRLLHDTVVGILKDIQLAYPAYRGIVRDIERLSLCVQTRGLGFFTLDLPNLDAILLEGIETGRLCPTGPLARVVSERIQVPRFLRGLWLRVFEPNACLRQEPDATAIAFLRQVSCIGKKIEVSCSRQRLKETLDEYYSIENSLRRPTLGWEYDELFSASGSDDVHFCDAIATRYSGPMLLQYEDSIEVRDARLLRSLQQVADDLVDRFKPYDPTDYSVRQAVQGLGATGFRHGPGAVADAKGRRGTIDKFLFPNWPRKLQTCFPYKYAGVGLSPIHADPVRPAIHEPPAELHAVPKTAKGPRLIAAEPIAHQWCQQLTKSYLEREIRKNIGSDFITFNDQSRSHELVRSSSLDRSLVTVDLSSASDRLSCWTIERIFRRNPSLLSALHSSRTRWLVSKVLPNEPNYLKLRKFASQGTAVTFPIQTLVFFICVLACLPGRDLDEKMELARGKVRIYGDDIVIPRIGYVSLIRLLELLQLKVNVKKSFAHSHFRESCGLDCFQGYDVTPVKPKRMDGRTPEGWMSLLELSNNLYYKGYWNAARVIERELHRTMPRRIRRSMLHVVGHSSGSAGLASYTGGALARSSRTRWNDRLHRMEVLSIRTRSEMHGSEPSGSSMLRRFFYEGSSPLAPRDGRLRTTLRVSNYPGWEPVSNYVSDVMGAAR